MNEHLTKMDSMKSSTLPELLKQEVYQFDQTLRGFKSTLEIILKCQSTWQSLRSVSGHGKQNQTKEDADKLQTADHKRKELLQMIADAPGCLEVARNPEIKEILQQVDQLLQDIKQQTTEIPEDAQ